MGRGALVVFGMIEAGFAEFAHLFAGGRKGSFTVISPGLGAPACDAHHGLNTDPQKLGKDELDDLRAP